MNTTSAPTLTGTYIAAAGIIVSALAHFNIIVTQDSIIAVIAGAVALYGVIHQFVVQKNATPAA